MNSHRKRQRCKSREPFSGGNGPTEPPVTPQPPSLSCGCAPTVIAGLNIIGGTGIATCTKEGKSNGKGSKWSMLCDTNQNGVADNDEPQLTNVALGKNCKMKSQLDCNQTPGEVTCDYLQAVQDANPSATFTCLAKSGKKETISCASDGLTSELTGSRKKLLKWATSSSCSSTPIVSCKCGAQVSGMRDVKCVTTNLYSCTAPNGATVFFQAKKCKKVVKTAPCATT